MITGVHKKKNSTEETLLVIITSQITHTHTNRHTHTHFIAHTMHTYWKLSTVTEPKQEIVHVSTHCRLHIYTHKSRPATHISLSVLSRDLSVALESLTAVSKKFWNLFVRDLIEMNRLIDLRPEAHDKSAG